MKIGTNTYFLSGHKAGIGYYTFNIIKALKEIDTQNEYQEIRNKFCLNKFLFEQIYLPLVLLLKKPQIYFSPSMVLPFFNFAPAVLVVYDLVFKLFPEYYRGKINLLYLSFFLKHSIAKAKKIIVISKNTKRDLIRLYGVPEDKVKVIYLAASAGFTPITDAKKLKEIKLRYNLPDAFILFVGTIEPRKNVRGLIQAYLSLPQALRSSKTLVICGQKGWGFQLLKSWLDKQQEKNSIIFLDYIKSEDLPLIYNLATLFVYPSFYEGFGLPILEAMSCGVPTITSSVSSMPEIAGDAATLIDPNNSLQLMMAMKEVLTNRQLAEEMSRKGLSRSAFFSWKKAARETLAVLYDTIK